jgi:branched-chain amino acid transport system ATP-binding protein
MRPDFGSIYFAGADITHRSMHDRLHLGLARSYQITNLYTAFTVLENVALAVQARTGTSFSFFRRILSERGLFEEARSILDKVGLSDRATEYVRNLSHGEQRQLEVAMVLATKPRLLLLDEPMAGMGHNELQKMVDLLSGLKRQVTILLVEHDMDAVFRLADRISVLVYGRVIVTGTPNEIRQNSEVRKAYLGEDVPA